MILIEFKIGEQVRIISIDEYNNHYGIITHIENDCYAVLTVKNPAEKYMVRINDAEKYLVKTND